MAKKPTKAQVATAAKAKQTTTLAIPDEVRMVDPRTNQPYIHIDFDLILEGDAAEDTEPVVLAAMKLLAGTSKEVQNDMPGAKPGLFFNTLTEKFSKSFVALPLYRYVERYRSLTPGEMGSPNICSSRDGRGQYGLCTVDPVEFNIPIVTITDKKTGQRAPFGDCEHCINQHFTTNTSGGRDKPKCREVHYVVCLDVSEFHDDEDFVQSLVEGNTQVIGQVISNLYAIPFSRTSMGTLKKIRNMNRLSGGAWFSRFWEFTAEKTQDSKHSWFKVAAKPMEGISQNGNLVARSLSKFIERLRGFDKLHARLDEAEVEADIPPMEKDDIVEVEVD